nr:relaxase/mobilization nuclease domain-containing protein [Enterococcus faecium]
MRKKIAPDHQIAIYTHTDKDHIHNHIVINSVNLELGTNFKPMVKHF